jgi:hypothetical protein
MASRPNYDSGEGGKYRFETIDQNGKLAWKGEGSLYSDDYVYGTWWSTKIKRVQGVMALLVQAGGNVLTGLYIGRNSDAEGGEERVGPWVMAKDAQDIESAKSWLDRSNIVFRSDVEVGGFRQKYHSYHLTQMRGRPIWRHHALDFNSGCPDPHILFTDITTFDHKNEKHLYHVEAGKRGAHVVMFFRPETAEKQSIALFPSFTTPGTNYGFLSGVNWDGNDFFGKVILSPDPLSGLEKEGDIPDDKMGLLDREWNREFVKKNKVPTDAFSMERRYTTKGIAGIYERVDRMLVERSSGAASVHIRILGFTLFSVPKTLRRWLQEGLLHSLNITLYHLDAAYLASVPKLFPSDWNENVGEHIKEIRDFLAKNKEALSRNKVTVEFVPYAHFPAVHGFSYGPNTYFVSFASRERNGTIRIPFEDVFLRVDRADRSEQAGALSDLFENWVEAAESSIKRAPDSRIPPTAA